MMDEAQQAIEADVEAFPWVAALICVLAVSPIVWGFVEALKTTGISKLKRKPKKDASERTIIGKIVKIWPWYPIAVWAISAGGGACLGLGVGAIDGFGDGDLGLWGLAFGALAGVLNSVIVEKGYGLAFGWLKKKLNGGKGAG
jgi:hypothetical protein